MPSSLVLAISCMPRQTPSTGVPRFRTASLESIDEAKVGEARRGSVPHAPIPARTSLSAAATSAGSRGTAMPHSASNFRRNCPCTDPRLPIPWSTMIIMLANTTAGAAWTTRRQARRRPAKPTKSREPEYSLRPLATGH